MGPCGFRPFDFHSILKIENPYFQCLIPQKLKIKNLQSQFSIFVAKKGKIKVPYPFFVFAWHWKTDLNFAFCSSFSLNFEKRIWTSYFFFCFRFTLKNGYEFRFSFSHYFEKRIWISFLVFASLWKTDLNFVCHFCMTWKTDHFTSPVIWSPGHPLVLRFSFPVLALSLACRRKL